MAMFCYSHRKLRRHNFIKHWKFWISKNMAKRPSGVPLEDFAWYPWRTLCFSCYGFLCASGFHFGSFRPVDSWTGMGGMDSQSKLLSELLSDQAVFITSPKTSLANYWGALPPCPPVSTGLGYLISWASGLLPLCLRCLAGYVIIHPKLGISESTEIVLFLWIIMETV